MNAQERDSVIAEITNLKTIHFLEVVTEKNQEQDLSAMRIGDQPLDKVASLWGRVLVQLESELQSGDYFLFPIAVNSQPYLPNFQLLANLQSLRTNLEANNLPALFSELQKNITYQIEWGFWDKSVRKIHNPDEIKIKELSKEIELQKESLKNEIEKLAKKREEVNKLQEELNLFYQTKQKELQEITTSLTASRQHKDEINTLFNQSNELKVQIQSVLDAQTKLFNDSKAAVATHEKEISDTKTKFKSDIKVELDAFAEKQKSADEYLKLLKEHDEQFRESLKFINDQRSFIESKREEIIKLTGFAADTVLAHSFDKRAKELRKGVLVWGVTSAVLTLFTVAWIFLLITNFATNFQLDQRWDTFLLNFFKTSPFFIALGFALTQYSKERGLLEEYSFKSAVALTINPYADKLDGTDGNKLKQQLIVDSIMNVYSKPKSLSHKDGNPTLEGINTIRESMKGDGKK